MGAWRCASLGFTGSCSDGSVGFGDPKPVTLSFGEYGTTVTIAYICGTLASATVQGDVATMDPFPCTVTTDSGATIDATFSGTLTRTGDQVAVDLDTSEQVTTGSGTTTCAISFTGTLDRQK